MHPLTSSNPSAPVLFQTVRQFTVETSKRFQAAPPQSEEHLAFLLVRLLNRSLRAKLRCPELIDDIRQEALIRVLVCVRRGQVREPGRLKAFALGVCHRVLCERLRQERRYVMGEDDMPDPVDHGPGPEREAANREQQESVARILALLSAKDREVLHLTFLEGMTRAEICHRLGVDRENLRVMLYRAKARFRDAAEKDHRSRPAYASRSGGLFRAGGHANTPDAAPVCCRG